MAKQLLIQYRLTYNLNARLFELLIGPQGNSRSQLVEREQIEKWIKELRGKNDWIDFRISRVEMNKLTRLRLAEYFELVLESHDEGRPY